MGAVGALMGPVMSEFRGKMDGGDINKILVKKIIHFIKIKNIQSIKIFIFLKSRIFIQTKYSFF